MFVSHGEPQPWQFVGNCKTSPSKSSSLNSPSDIGCKMALLPSCLSSISSWEKTPGTAKIII